MSESHKSKKSSKSKDSKKKDKKGSSSKESKKNKTESSRTHRSSSKKADSAKGTPKKSKKSDKGSSKKSNKSNKSPIPSAPEVDIQSMKTNPDVTPKQFKNSQIDGGYPQLNTQNPINATQSNYGNFLSQGGEGAFGMPQRPQQFDLKSCMLHNKPLRYFCESCEELVCYDCTVMGPHNTQLHRVSSLDDAYKYRFELINRQIHQSLVPKRAQLIGQIVRMDHRLDEVKTVKNVIERDIRNEYSAIMERLRSAEGVKTAVLQHDIAEIQKDITRIDEILMFMEEVTQPKTMQQTENQQDQNATQQNIQPVEIGPDYLAFLHNFRQLNENIEYSVTKQFKVEISVVPNDLPRELAERQVLLEHYEEQRKLLKFKDDVIWKLSQELKKKYDFYQDVCDKETRHEMNEWVRLVDSCVSELKKYELVCAFCGRHLSDSNVNTDCNENIGGITPSDVSQQDAAQFTQSTLYFTEEEPNQEVIGKRRHWFGKPSIKGYKQNTLRNNPTQSTTSLLKDEIVLQNPELNSTIRNLSQDDCMNILREQFLHKDDQRLGVIKKNDFINILFENARQVKPAEVMTFVNTICTNYQDFVNYDQILTMLEKYRDDPSKYSTIQPILKEEQIYHKLNKKDREFLDKVRADIYDCNPKETFRKFGKGTSDLISQDELLIALSRLNSNFFLGDVKQLFNIVKENSQSLAPAAEDEIEINELILFLKL